MVGVSGWLRLERNDKLEHFTVNFRITARSLKYGGETSSSFPFGEVLKMILREYLSFREYSQVLNSYWTEIAGEVIFTK